VAEETWSWREGPILEAAVTADAQGHDIAQAIHDEAGLADDDRMRGIAALVEDGYLVGIDVTSGGDPWPMYLINGVTGKARRATRQWPATGAYDDFVDLLEQRIASTGDEAKKSRLRAVLDAVSGLGKDITTDVLAKLIEHQAGVG
jgi:hypothetical protein